MYGVQSLGGGGAYIGAGGFEGFGVLHGGGLVVKVV